jgi:hypothetical protein
MDIPSFLFSSVAGRFDVDDEFRLVAYPSLSGVSSAKAVFMSK